MSFDDNTERQIRKEKKSHDRIAVSIIGMVLYSILLIAVMMGSYLAVKTILRNYDMRMAAEAEEKETEDGKQDADKTPTPKPTPKPKPSPKPTPEPTPEPEEEEEINHVKAPEEMIDHDTGILDYSVTHFKPAKRNVKLKWKDEVFSKIEDVKDPARAPVNTFDYRRVSVRLADNDSSEYKVYSDPETKEVKKITEICKSGDSLEVIDYYYDDEGFINYAAQYKTYVDKPIKISSTDIESRYYFRDDTLVRYIYCKDKTATEYTVGEIDTYSKGTVNQYDYLEQDMINRAYIVFNVATSIKETQMLYGYVLDEFSMPMEDARIEVRKESDDSVVAESITDGDGYYKIAVDCDDDVTYRLTANKDTLESVDVYGITAKHGSGKYAVEPVYMGYMDNTTVYPTQFAVKDATDENIPLSGAAIGIRRGFNNRTGEVIQTGELGEDGTATVDLISGSYTAEVTKDGYETLFMSVVVRLDHQFAIGFAMPEVEKDSYAVAVYWESVPVNLNAAAVSYNRGRIIRSTPDSEGFSSAETVSIENAGEDDFRFYVMDSAAIASGDVMAYNMTISSAYADVYDSNGLIGKFHVPVASAGVIWEAFEIRDKTLLPVNSYFYAVDDDPLWKTE